MSQIAQKQEEVAQSAAVIDFGAYRQSRAKADMATSMLMAALHVTADNLALKPVDDYLSAQEVDVLECMIGCTAALCNSMPGRVERDVLRTFNVYELDELTLSRLPAVANFLQEWRN